MARIERSESVDDRIALITRLYKDSSAFRDAGRHQLRSYGASVAAGMPFFPEVALGVMGFSHRGAQIQGQMLQDADTKLRSLLRDVHGDLDALTTISEHLRAITDPSARTRAEEVYLKGTNPDALKGQRVVDVVDEHYGWGAITTVITQPEENTPQVAQQKQSRLSLAAKKVRAVLVKAISSFGENVE